MDKGFREVVTLSAAISRNVPRVGVDARKALRKSAKSVERIMRSNAPVDTGSLRNSISTTFYGDGRSRRLGAIIGPQTDHDIYPEFGTATQAPQPYAAPAGSAVEKSFILAMEKAGEVET